ncbi:MAG: hypothetical protein QNK24_14715, partial [Desulfuromusa sp.]|nr:hypothetical protein [Desulfuromusa sp.]
MKSFTRLIMVAMLFATLSMFGCSGDDGDDGASGQSAYEIAVDNGFDGTEQEWLDSLSAADTAAVESESCAVCHSSVEAIHAEAGIAAITDQSSDLAGDLVITVTLEVDGIATNENYQLYRVYQNYDDPTQDDGDDTPARTTNAINALLNMRGEDAADCTDSDNCTVANTLGAFGSSSDGVFTITVPAAEVDADAAYAIVLRDLDATSDDGWGHSEPGTVLVTGTSPLRDLVSDDGVSVGCAACHGASASSLFDHYLTTGDECQACHTIYGRSADSYAQIDGEWVNQGSTPGGNLTEYVHGIHNSHSMPSGMYVRGLDDDDMPEDSWSIGYPSAMRNCVSCHVTEDQLAAAVEAPVSFYLCMTCHQDFDGFVHGHDAADGSYSAGDQIFAADDFHRGAGVDTDCMGCHGAIESLDEVGDFHNDFQSTDAHYNSFYRGEDISFANTNDVEVAIAGVTSDGSAVSFTWTASTGAGAVDPCNTTIADGPTFQALGAYLAYAKGDDWVNEFASSAPGQPAGAMDVFGELTTTCAANIATTTGLVLAEDTMYADKVLLAVGGKPLDMHSSGNAYFVREPSPTYAFNAADGTAAEARRDAVDNDKCLACHQGTLYQHGGDRVDNEQLCVICHNPSSSDKNNRLDRYQIINADGTINTDATYDGKDQETYDMRAMV